MQDALTHLPCQDGPDAVLGIPHAGAGLPIAGDAGVANDVCTRLHMHHPSHNGPCAIACIATPCLTLPCLWGGSWTLSWYQQSCCQGLSNTENTDPAELRC